MNLLILSLSQLYIRCVTTLLHFRDQEIDIYQLAHSFPKLTHLVKWAEMRFNPSL